MSARKVKIAVVGCGNVEGQYAKHLVNYSHVEIGGFQDLMPERAEAFVQQYGGQLPSDDRRMASVRPLRGRKFARRFIIGYRSVLENHRFDLQEIMP